MERETSHLTLIDSLRREGHSISSLPSYIAQQFETNEGALLGPIDAALRRITKYCRLILPGRGDIAGEIAGPAPLLYREGVEPAAAQTEASWTPSAVTHHIGEATTVAMQVAAQWSTVEVRNHLSRMGSRIGRALEEVVADAIAAATWPAAQAQTGAFTATVLNSAMESFAALTGPEGEPAPPATTIVAPRSMGPLIRAARCERIMDFVANDALGEGEYLIVSGKEYRAFHWNIGRPRVKVTSAADATVSTKISVAIPCAETLDILTWDSTSSPRWSVRGTES